MNPTSDGHLPINRILLAYRLPEGSRVQGFGAAEIQTVMVVYAVSEEDTFTVSYTLVSESLGVLPFSGFIDGDIPDASKLSIDELEIITMGRVESGLKNHKTGTLEWSTNQPILEYRLPLMQCGRDTVQVKVECYWPKVRKYFVVLRLMHGKTDLGIIGARRLRGVAISFPELCTRVKYMTEALMPDDLETLAEQLIDKQEPEMRGGG